MWRNVVSLLVLLLFVQNSYTQSAANTNTANGANAGLSFDFIVVGGGAGGSVIARRLSDCGTYSVLLIDAGNKSQRSVGGTDYVASSFYFNGAGNAVIQTPFTRYDVPAFAASAQQGITPFSPTPGFQVISPQGTSEEHSRILGGNSVHNNMQWNRQSITTINSWNLNGWSYNDLLPYFKKSENVSSTHLAGNTTYHGDSGPIQVTEPQARDPSGAIWNQACVNAGYGATNDFSGPSPIGCGLPLFNIDTRGVRASSLNAYFAPAQGRPNLSLITSAWVTKVLFLRTSNAATPKAVGIQYVLQNDDGTHNDSNVITVRANKEVILAAGGLNSPKLLLLSGIGPKQNLQAVGVPVIVDAPVGMRQGIHYVTQPQFNYTSTINNPNALSFPSIQYAINGTGLFASVGFPCQAMLKSNASLDDFDFIATGNVASSTPNTFTVTILLTNPTQRDGQTMLTSSYYRDPIYFNYTKFEQDADVTALAHSIQITRNITRTYPGSNTFGNEITPGAQYATLDQLKSWVRSGGGRFSTTHLFGGCQMGNANDALAPLDNHARVKGVTGLRVCDLSICPGAFNGSPMANVVAWCEKVSDYIIQDNSNNNSKK